MYEGVVASGSLCTCSWQILSPFKTNFCYCCCTYAAHTHTHTHTHKKIVKEECLLISKLGVHPSSNA